MQTPHIVLVGVSHHTAPVELRERVDFAARGLEDALRAVMRRPTVGEAVVLSTCNRAELYAVGADGAALHEDLAEFFSEYHRVPAPELAPHLYTRYDGDAVRHLFRVAAGLDSLVVGEPQIFGQVKDAYTAATEQHATGPILNKLFHWAFLAGKRVRTETGLAEGAVSVSYAAIALARKIFGDLRQRHALVIGTGEMAELTAVHLAAQQMARLLVTGRTAAHAEALAAKVGGTVIPWTELPAALASADIVVTATGSPTLILSAAAVDAAMRARRHRPLFIIDIAVPRDVDPAAGRIEQVFLYNIDDLEHIVRENLARRARQIERAEAIVTEEVGGFMAWLGSRRAIPTVVALRQRFDEIRRAELKRLEPKLAKLPPEARARIDEITRLIVEKLLLTPTEQLKRISEPETVAAYSDALNRLFSLTEQELLSPVGQADLAVERPDPLAAAAPAGAHTAGEAGAPEGQEGGAFERAKHPLEP